MRSGPLEIKSEKEMLYKKQIKKKKKADEGKTVCTNSKEEYWGNIASFLEKRRLILAKVVLNLY